MTEPLSPLLIQFLEWISCRSRSYAEAMDAWRSSCPRLTVWEDALLGGLIEVDSTGSRQEARVALTSQGKAILDSPRD